MVHNQRARTRTLARLLARRLSRCGVSTTVRSSAIAVAFYKSAGYQQAEGKQWDGEMLRWNHADCAFSGYFLTNVDGSRRPFPSRRPFFPSTNFLFPFLPVHICDALSSRNTRVFFPPVIIERLYFRWWLAGDYTAAEREFADHPYDS